MDFWENLWGTIWFFFWTFAIISYFFALFAVVFDLFRDRQLNGWAKAAWFLFLFFVPFLTVLIYVIARGQGMAERSSRESRQYQAETDDYIRSVARTGSGASEEISRAKALLDAGTISPAEFESLKAKALSSSSYTE
ncbi:SHOCT domain-containing protein [Cryobacterium cryoconiti]|uniref:SHOCT domain-containing protein n=1 Tax=Cryobacterium cryoconiti TaxID=1259239 RepID=A0A4Y8JSZ5_9MICO|nr:SHOCT domain-containing protein [Cryobacterium cryoconiti]TFD27897.1 SHOCT domain-containing protein [Cryobacterium cryoconiti]